MSAMTPAPRPGLPRPLTGGQTLQTNPLGPLRPDIGPGTLAQSAGLVDTTAQQPGMSEARARLAQAIMSAGGGQQQVQHPMQALGNTVSQLGQAWMQKRQQSRPRTRPALTRGGGQLPKPMPRPQQPKGGY